MYLDDQPIYRITFFANEEEIEPAEILIQNGTDAYAAGDYKEALANFEKLKDWYPFSQHVVLAELRIADSHYHLKAYEEAIFAYEEFTELHPSNEAIPYVRYQIGRCYFDQMETIDRDQTATVKALNTFEQLQKQHPQSPYSEMASEHINRCLKNLARNDLYIAVFYYKSKKYRAALKRFKMVVTQYPDVGIQWEALQYIVKCEAKLEKNPVQPDTEPFTYLLF